MSDRWFSLVLLALGFAALGSCGDDVRTPSEIALEVDASQEVKDAMAVLRFTARRLDSTSPKATKFEDYPVAKLKWPVDLHLIPDSEKDLGGTVEIVLEARDAAGVTLVQQRALTAFAKGGVLRYPVYLAACGLMPLRALCNTTPSCGAEGCSTCVRGQCAATPRLGEEPLPDAGPRDAGPEDAGPEDAGPNDGGPNDGGPKLDGAPAPRDADAELDASDASDAAADAADADADADAADADAAPLPDPVEPDAGPVVVDPPPPPLDCTADANWSLYSNGSTVPANALLVGQPHIDGVSYNQYLCRTPAGIPGKVNATPQPAKFEGACWIAAYDGITFSSQPTDNGSPPAFQVLTTPAGCMLTYVSHSGATLPGNAKVTGHDEGGQPLYSCRVAFNDTSSQGYHGGRVSAAGDVCHVQYFGAVSDSTSFEVLVQLAP